MSDLLAPSKDLLGKQTEPELPDQSKQKPPEPPPAKIPEKKDNFKSDREDPSLHARKLAETPQRFGHKISASTTLIKLAHRQAAQSSGRTTTSYRAPVSYQNYQRLAREPVFKPSNMRETSLFQSIQSRAIPERGKTQTMNPSDLSRMIQIRHQVSDRTNLYRIIRYEMHQRREEGHDRTSRQRGADRSNQPRLEALLRRLGMSSGDSAFEGVLRQMMSGREVVRSVPRGTTVPLGAKSDVGWRGFFSSVLKLGSGELSAARQTATVVEALFRGLYRALADQKGMTLVSDLRFAEGDRQVTTKFTRMSINQTDLLKSLEQLKPGDQIAREMLMKLGEELEFTRLVNQQEQVSTEAREAAREAALAQLRSPVNPEAMAKMEQFILRERLKRAEQQAQLIKGQDERDHRSRREKRPPFAFWGDPRWEREERIGKPRMWVMMTFGVAAITLALILYILIRHFA